MGKDHNENNFYSRVNSFLVIQNKKLAIDNLNKFSNKKTANSFSIYDFSTLYTNTAHVLKTLNYVTYFALKSITQSKIYISNYN